jgi:hypothetical protein
MVAYIPYIVKYVFSIISSWEADCFEWSVRGRKQRGRVHWGWGKLETRRQKLESGEGGAAGHEGSGRRGAHPFIKQTRKGRPPEVLRLCHRTLKTVGDAAPKFISVFLRLRRRHTVKLTGPDSIVGLFRLVQNPAN